MKLLATREQVGELGMFLCGREYMSLLGSLLASTARESTRSLAVTDPFCWAEQGWQCGHPKTASNHSIHLPTVPRLWPPSATSNNQHGPLLV